MDVLHLFRCRWRGANYSRTASAFCLTTTTLAAEELAPSGYNTVYLCLRVTPTYGHDNGVHRPLPGDVRLSTRHRRDVPAPNFIAVVSCDPILTPPRPQ